MISWERVKKKRDMLSDSEEGQEKKLLERRKTHWSGESDGIYTTR